MMYKPPENSNRVKSIKSKFENIQSTAANNGNGVGKIGIGRHDRNKTDSDKEASAAQRQNLLSRQLSDPVKRNIKRTPAFRLDKNNDKTKPFQRNSPQNRSHYFESTETKPVSALKNDCDNFSSVKPIETKNGKPPLLKSKSSHDFAYIRNKFNATCGNENQRNVVTAAAEAPPSKDLSLLYTEPIPKLLRNKPQVVEKQNDIYNAETLKIRDVKPLIGDCITDTLKTALKRPLPTGPAPKKPPRTFEHCSKAAAAKNESFLHLLSTMKKDTAGEKKSTPQKKDAKYMLSKLEMALKNNTLKSTKSPAEKEVSTTSGDDDSDDSLLFKSKSNPPPPPPPPAVSPLASQKSFKLNCLDGLASCNNSPYGKIGESNSLFFISPPRSAEPVYAEPFQFSGAGKGVEEEGRAKKTDKNIRNSLYYMSTSLLCDDDKICRNMDDTQNVKLPQSQTESHQSNRKMSTSENSSLSSFTSDSAASTPLEEHKPFDAASSTVPKIKRLIDVFEPKTNGADDAAGDNNNRVEDLKMSLQKTLDRCFAGDAIANGDAENERKGSIDHIINRFQTYVKTVPKYRQPRMSKEDRLFYCCLIVEWNRTPQIKFKFPNDVEIPQRIEDLCYPEATSGPLDKSKNSQCYSLVITNDKGERTFGYCRRVIPEGSIKCLPLVYCILSKHRAPRFYKKILAELESRHGIPDRQRNELIGEFYRNKFPAPGESIKIDLAHMLEELKAIRSHRLVSSNNNNNNNRLSDDGSLDLTSFVHVNGAGQYGTLNNRARNAKATGGVHQSYENIFVEACQDGVCPSTPNVIVDNGKSVELILTLHQDSRYEDADLKPLHSLPPDILIKIFASLLLERKVILISCVISKLSCCVDALQSILYPFSWPHTYIPILPQCLWDVVESPTPVVCGILSVAVVNQYTIEHGIVVDLDEGSILIEVGDENSILSDSMKKAWSQGLALANTIPRDNYVHSVYLSDAYMKVFILCFKNYKNYIVDGNFQKENFIKSGKSKGIRRFLKWFAETTLFLTFIDLVISNSESFALFDKKMEIYGSEESNMILNKLLEWKK